MAGHSSVPTTLLQSLTQTLRNVAWPPYAQKECDEIKDLPQQNTKKPRLITEGAVQALAHATDRALGLPRHPAPEDAQDLLPSGPEERDVHPRSGSDTGQRHSDGNIADHKKLHLDTNDQSPQQPQQLPADDKVPEQDQQGFSTQGPSTQGLALEIPGPLPSQDESQDSMVTPRQDLVAQPETDRGGFSPCTLAATMSLFESKVLDQYLGSFEVQNCRPYQEDRTACVWLDGSLILGLFDGHAGQNTSSYLQEYLLQVVCQKLQDGLEGPEALQQSFMLVNSRLRRLHSSFYSGSTATVVLVDGGRIVCANAGDSPAFIVSRSGQATCLTIDHNPNTNDNERLRIKAAGGRIEKMHWGERYMRVLSYDSMSGLAMTRAFGDFNFTGVICDPHVCSVDAAQDAAFLVLASDGLTEQWDVQGAAAAVCELACAGHSPQEIASHLSQRAIDKGSRDNISVLVLDLQKYQASDASSGKGL